MPHNFQSVHVPHFYLTFTFNTWPFHWPNCWASSRNSGVKIQRHMRTHRQPPKPKPTYIYIYMYVSAILTFLHALNSTPCHCPLTLSIFILQFVQTFFSAVISFWPQIALSATLPSEITIIFDDYVCWK